MKFSKQQQRYMQRAIELARRGLGRTAPNPAVGAVIVRGGRIVGEGFHARAGTPHAEQHALRRAGQKAHGADLYVTLEPCNHQGRTPPCVERLIAAGVKRVFVGTIDPNPLMRGKSLRRLRAAGIDVRLGVLRDECEALVRGFAMRMKSGRPYVICKAAITLDGRIATASGESQWISGPAGRRVAHQLRDASDAIMVGAETVRCDNPQLTVRLHGKPRLLTAVIVSSDLNLPRSLRVWRRPPGTVIVLTTRRAKTSMHQWIELRGQRVVECRETRDGRVDLRDGLRQLAQYGIGTLLVEGGGHIFSQLFAHQLADRMVACIAPKFLGGGARSVLPDVQVRNLQRAPQLTNVRIVPYGNDVVIEGDLR